MTRFSDFFVRKRLFLTNIVIFLIHTGSFYQKKGGICQHESCFIMLDKSPCLFLKKQC